MSTMSTMSTNKKPKLCLNMIVKDEAHIITETLDSVSKYIDYYVINDTGSKDNTIEVIKNYFDKKNIKGEIYSHEFRTCKCHMGIYKKYDFFHFGWNRSYALDLCRGKSEYIIVIDADDIIIGDPNFSNLKADCGTVTIGNDFTYKRSQVFKNDPKLNWKYTGVLHEYPNCDKPNYTIEHVPGNFYYESRRLGDRSKDTKKYLRDALTFEEVLKDEPDNERYMFYCGQSYFDYQDYNNSMRWYKKRIEKGGWYEEVYYSYFKVAEAMEKLGYPWSETEKAFMDAHKYCDIRAEPICAIAEHYMNAQDYENCYRVAKSVEDMKFPKKCDLFVQKTVYDYGIKILIADSAYKLGKFTEAFSIYKKLFQHKLIPQHLQERSANNFKLAEIKVKEATKETCCIYVGYMQFDKNHVAYDFVNDLSSYHKVYLVGNNIQTYDFSNIVILSVESMKNYYEVKPTKDSNGKNKQQSKEIILSTKQTFDHLFLLDNINYYFDHLNIKSQSIYLVMFRDTIKIHLLNGSEVSLYNNVMLNNMLSSNNATSIKRIICVDPTENHQMLVNFINNYSLNKNDIDVLNSGADVYKFFSETTRKNKKFTFKSNNENNTNGYVLRTPQYINYMIENRSTLETADDIILEYYNSIIKYMNNIPEAQFFKINYLYQIGNYVESSKLLEGMIKAKDNINMNDIVNTWNVKSLIKNKKMQEAYDISTDILRRNNIFSGLRMEIEKLRDSCVNHIKDQFLKYPAAKIKSIKQQCELNTSRNIIFSMTTCKRYDLFEKTMNSFINCCEDLHLIDYWLCVDDNSSEQDRYKMKQLYPFIEFVLKDEKQKGHCVSMNIIQDFATKNNAKYLLHTEDDWLYFEKNNYITKFMEVLNENPKYGQVLFNRNYAEIGRDDIYIGGGIVKQTKNNMRYWEHEYYPTGTPEYNNFIERNKGYSTCGYWPHFSFRPSLINCKIYQDVGLFYNTPHFEMAYAHDYVKCGYLSAFLDTYACIHIGKKTWEKNGENSYKLNNTEQFTFENNEMNINVLNYNMKFVNGADNTVSNLSVEMFKQFKQSTNNILPYYIHQNLSNVDNLSDIQKKIFNGNNFNYRKDIINYLSTFLDLFKSSNNKNLFVIKDNMKLNNNCGSVCNYLLSEIKQNMSKYDVVLLPSGMYLNTEPMIIKSQKLIVNIYDNSIGGLIFTPAGMTKIMTYLEQNGLKDMHNLLDVNKLDIYELNNNMLEVINPTISMQEIVNQNSTRLPQYNGYKFYSQMDSFGEDVGHFNLPVHELINMCNNDPRCIGFNTSGWVKYNIKPDDQLVGLYRSERIDEGLYVKIK